MIETTDTDDATSQREQCKRCKEKKELFERDPRWKRVCTDCHSELLDQYGTYPKQQQNRNRQKERGDGQLVGSPPPEEI